MHTRTVLSSSPLSAEKSFMEEANFKVGRYNAEERKERIDRYRAKRTQRNFNKTIKYACRKTLADTRPRIRGRFARNDETGEIPKASMFQRYEDDDDVWVNTLRQTLTFTTSKHYVHLQEIVTFLTIARKVFACRISYNLLT